MSEVFEQRWSQWLEAKNLLGRSFDPIKMVVGS